MLKNCPFEKTCDKPMSFCQTPSCPYKEALDKKKNLNSIKDIDQDLAACLTRSK